MGRNEYGTYQVWDVSSMGRNKYNKDLGRNKYGTYQVGDVTSMGRNEYGTYQVWDVSSMVLVYFIYMLCK